MDFNEMSLCFYMYFKRCNTNYSELVTVGNVATHLKINAVQEKIMLMSFEAPLIFSFQTQYVYRINIHLHPTTMISKLDLISMISQPIQKLLFVQLAISSHRSLK